MFLDNIKNSPYNRGRWYHAFLESDGTTEQITTNDPELNGISFSGGNLIIPNSMNIVDYKVCLHVSGGTATTAKSYQPKITRGSTGASAISAPDKTMYDYCDVWIFGYYD